MILKGIWIATIGFMLAGCADSSQSDAIHFGPGAGAEGTNSEEKA